LQDQSSRDSLTGLANELGLSNWLASRDLTQSWLVVGVFFGANQRLGAMLGPVRLITIRQFIAQHMRTFGAVLTARADSARYVLAFPDTVQSLAHIAELRRAFNHFEAHDDIGHDISLHGTTRVLRLHPGDQPNSLLVMATLATLTERQQSTEAGVVAVHNFSRELQESLQRQTQRNESPAKFCFEITESNAIDDVEGSRSIVQALRAEGFRVSIDDFGTGFATYSYLKRYEVDEIKIDGNFVTALGENKMDIEIVQSIVRIAKMLGVTTVAEFVASDALRVQVERLGVDYVQGYAIGMPQPIAAMYPAVA
jgi:EAL domain